MNTGLHDWYQGWLRLRQSWYCSAEKHCNCRSAMAMVMMVMTMKIKVTMGLFSWTNCRSTWQGKQPALIGYYNAMHHNQKERVGWKFSRNFGGWFHFCHRDSIFPWFNMDWADVFCLLWFLFLQILPRSLNKMWGAGDSMGVTLASEDPALARGASWWSQQDLWWEVWGQAGHNTFWTWRRRRVVMGRKFHLVVRGVRKICSFSTFRQFLTFDCSPKSWKLGKQIEIRKLLPENSEDKPNKEISDDWKKVLTYFRM